MKRVTGIGGVFFKAKDPVALRAWYRKHLEVDVQPWGGAVFPWVDDSGEPARGMTTWNIADAKSDYFAPSLAAFMINYRVADVRALVEALRAEGCNVVGDIQESEYGGFAWVVDPEGNKIELWQPPPEQ